MKQRGRPPQRPEKRGILHIIGALLSNILLVLDRIVKLLERQPPGEQKGGHFSMHVTEVIYPPKETIMPPIDHTPPLDLASSSVRAKLSVINPRLPDGSRVTSVTWSTDDETELPLEAAPDDTAKDTDGNEILDPVDNLPLLVFSTYANTPLTPEPPAKADGTVTCGAPGMASIDKLVRYGDAPVGHFTMVATEAPEV